MTVTSPPPTDTAATIDDRALSVAMREGSAAEHRDAESSAFMATLTDGGISPAGYAEYLARFRRVYAALESVGADLADHPVAGQMVDRSLDRLAALDADLDFWSGGSAPVVDSPAADTYARRIEATRADPALFVAHHYTRYLGDLSGGQVIGRILTREFDLAPGEGVAFYRFAAVPKPKPYKDAYRARLDALPVDAAERGRIVDEVRAVFGLNGAIFAELSAQLDRLRR